jgi:hypothetical protein
MSTLSGRVRGHDVVREQLRVLSAAANRELRDTPVTNGRNSAEVRPICSYNPRRKPEFAAVTS